MTPEEDAIIDRAITETYALKDITPDSEFANAEPPLLSDFEMVLAGMDGAESLVQKLQKYLYCKAVQSTNPLCNMGLLS